MDETGDYSSAVLLFGWFLWCSLFIDLFDMLFVYKLKLLALNWEVFDYGTSWKNVGIGNKFRIPCVLFYSLEKEVHAALWLIKVAKLSTFLVRYCCA